MKKITIHFLWTALLMLVCSVGGNGAVQALRDTSPLPWCYPGTTCASTGAQAPNNSRLDRSRPRLRALCYPTPCGTHSRTTKTKDGGPLPWCYPGTSCSIAALILADTGPLPWCYPGTQCATQGGGEAAQTLADTFPPPWCYPGTACAAHSRATATKDGNPLPWCYPGTQCAIQGGGEAAQPLADTFPPPWCYPGQPCIIGNI